MSSRSTIWLRCYGVMGFHDTRSIGKDLCSGIMGEGGGKAGGDPGRHTTIKRYPEVRRFALQDMMYCIRAGVIRATGILLEVIRSGGIRAGGILLEVIRAGGIRAGGIRSGGIRAGVIRATGILLEVIRAGGIRAGGIRSGGIRAGGIRAGGIRSGGIRAGGILLEVIRAGDQGIVLGRQTSKIRKQLLPGRFIVTNCSS